MLGGRAVLAAALVLGLGGPALASDKGQAEGEIKEIIVKIQTPDGPRWYVLGKDLEEINVNEGDYVRFNYADDTIESFEVQDVGPGKNASGNSN